MTSPGPGLSSPMLIVETQLNSRLKYDMDICVCKFRIIKVKYMKAKCCGLQSKTFSDRMQN